MESFSKKSISKREIIQIALNILIVIFVITGLVIMMNNKQSGSGLTSVGFENLKYFTVLSNVFCGLVAILWLCMYFSKKRLPVLIKLMSSSAVGLTFLIIAAFLAPLYPDLDLYDGSNRWFHLIVPVAAMIEIFFINTDKKMPFYYTLLSASLSLLYGMGYLINILINGIGEWPDTNDWYGFLNWGLPAGMVIFAFIVLMNWGIACLFRFIISITPIS